MGKVWIKWVCSYQFEIEYQITVDGRAFRAELRETAPDFARAHLNSDGLRDLETGIGILRACASEAAGEIAAPVIAAFNEWRARDHAAMIAHMRARPDRYGADISEFETAPAHVSAGRWSRDSGWSRIEAPADFERLEVAGAWSQLR